MFSSLAQRLGPRVLARLDLLVELSTLGEYGIDRKGVFAVEPDVEPASPGARPFGRSRDDCPYGGRVNTTCRDAPARP